ncbi:MAG: DUF2089 domain-containing protein [Oscillospiraceae bacterium]|nr:DUF2089 domain-containing protein [Oscillospiraceae bacterium]
MANTDYRMPSKCPVCGGALECTRLNCEHCGTEMTGRFTLCRFCALEEKHLRFVETFLRCRGSIKDAEKALGVSYPTVKGMLEAALNALDLGEAIRPEPGDVLDKLGSGDIDVETALKLLKQ